MALTPDRRVPDSGIEVKPVYGGRTLPAARARAARRVPVHARAPYPDMYRGRPWTIRQYAGFASAEESNERFRYLLGRGQTGLSIAFDLPTQLGYDSDDAVAAGEVGRTGVAIDSIADMEIAARRDPARRGLDLDDDQRAGVAAAPALRARRRGAGRARRGAARHGPERHPQGVHRARELHLPAAAVDAADDGSVRLLRRADPAAGTRSRSPATTSARPARRRRRSSHSRSRTGSPTARRRSRRASRRTRSASGSRSSSTRTTTSSRRSRSSAPLAACGRRSCATASAPRIRRRRRCASTRRPAARR